MRKKTARPTWWKLAPVLATGVLPSCLAGLQGSLDLLLGHNAFDNAMRLPYSSVAGLADLFARWVWIG